MKLNLIDCGVLKNFHAMMETMPVTNIMLWYRVRKQEQDKYPFWLIYLKP